MRLNTAGRAGVTFTEGIRLRLVAISFLVTLAVVLGEIPAPARAAAPDSTPSPAGPVAGTIVIFSPAFGTVPAGMSAPSGLTAPRVLPTTGGPTLPAILLTSPTSVGSLVVPVQLPAISGAGPAFTQLQLVIPGPNPAQNTPIALAQLLDMVLRSPQMLGSAGIATPTSPVSVLATTSP